MTRRNLFRLLAVACALPLALVLAKRKGTNQKLEANRSTSAAISAHADSFTLGELVFQSCDLGLRLTGGTTRAYCAPFQVPEDWDEPTGRKLDLHLALIKSDADAADTDVVVFLDGGPGQAATEDYPVMAAALSPLRKHHHILLLDQRGTGQSHPLVCKGQKEKPDETANEKDFDPEEVRRQTKDCLDEVVKTSDPRQYTTTVATRDLEALRQSIGAPLFDLVGVSYGTRTLLNTLFVGPLLMPALFVILINTQVTRQLEKADEPLELPVIGAEYAPNLVQTLKENGVKIKPGPSDPEHAVRDRDAEVVLRIPARYPDDWQGDSLRRSKSFMTNRSVSRRARSPGFVRSSMPTDNERERCASSRAASRRLWRSRLSSPSGISRRLKVVRESFLVFCPSRSFSQLS